jgi:hypothetical protein
VPVNAPANTAIWHFDVAGSGQHQVYARWTAHPNRATNAVYQVVHNGGTDSISVNQQQQPAEWVLLGTYGFDQGIPYQVNVTDEADGYVIADAIMLAPENAAHNSFTWNITIPASGEYEVFARWSSHPNRASDAKFTVVHNGGDNTVTMNQRQSGNQWNSLGAFTFTQGISYSVTLTDRADGYVIADAIRLVPLE